MYLYKYKRHARPLSLLATHRHALSIANLRPWTRSRKVIPILSAITVSTTALAIRPLLAVDIV